MQINLYENATQVCNAAAAMLAEQLIRKPDSVLGLATGSTPILTYRELTRLYREGVIDFSRARSFNLDEYCNLPAEHECSYHSFMRSHLFDNINMKPENARIPNGNADDLEAECREYDAAIAEAGGIDMQVLGIGRNGHIGFNEPNDKFIYGCHIVELTQSTIEANRRFFESEAKVPRRAISLGVGAIMTSKRVLLLATGETKADAIRRTVFGDIDPAAQSTILRVHPDVILLLDKAAASKL